MKKLLIVLLSIFVIGVISVKAEPDKMPVMPDELLAVVAEVQASPALIRWCKWFSISDDTIEEGYSDECIDIDQVEAICGDRVDKCDTGNYGYYMVIQNPFVVDSNNERLVNYDVPYDAYILWE